MKEITRIITAQITQVYKTSDDEVEARIKRVRKELQDLSRMFDW